MISFEANRLTGGVAIVDRIECSGFELMPALNVTKSFKCAVDTQVVHLLPAWGPSTLLAQLLLYIQKMLDLTVGW